MMVIALKTELDVAILLLANGWLPDEINSILVFPLPEAALHGLWPKNNPFNQVGVTKDTPATPTTLYRARQLLQGAGWREQELNSLLKPCLYSVDPWLNQTLHSPVQPCLEPPASTASWHWLNTPRATVSLQKYRQTMALKRLVSLGLIITGVCVAIMLAG